MKARIGLILLAMIGLVPRLRSEPPAEKSGPPIRVAIFFDTGTGESREKVVAALKSDAAIRIDRLKAEDIRAGRLADYDVLIHPGGSGSKQGRALAEEGRAAVRHFVSGGGGYVGFCAGAYLATNDYDWSLNLIDAKVLDRRHWARGKGPVPVRLSPKGRKFFAAEDDEVTIYYAQGPLLARREWEDPEVPDYESLGLFAGEIVKNGAPRGIMAGTTAIARAEFGQGRVFCFSPHPELTDGLAAFVPRAVRWAAAADLSLQKKTP